MLALRKQLKDKKIVIFAMILFIILTIFGIYLTNIYSASKYKFIIFGVKNDPDFYYIIKTLSLKFGNNSVIALNIYDQKNAKLFMDLVIELSANNASLPPNVDASGHFKETIWYAPFYTPMTFIIEDKELKAVVMWGSQQNFWHNLEKYINKSNNNAYFIICSKTNITIEKINSEKLIEIIQSFLNNH